MRDKAVEPLVQVRGLGKVYMPSPLWLRFLLRSSINAPVVALEDVSLEVRPGEICAVVGPNGAGKSTLFRILVGLTTPTSGSASIMGLDVTSQAVAVRRLVGFMPADERSLWLRQTCWENLLFHGRLQGIPSSALRERIARTLELLGLSHVAGRAGFALSSGMRARLQLARALLHEPSVLILDEPTGSVDPMGSYELLETLRKMAVERGLAVLLSSHRLEEIEALHDNVALLDQGRLVHYGDLDALRRLWEKRPRIEISFVDQADLEEAAGLLRGFEQVEILGRDAHTLTLTSSIGLGRLLTELDGRVGRIRSIHERKMSLRELLTSTFGRGGR